MKILTGTVAVVLLAHVVAAEEAGTLGIGSRLRVQQATGKGNPRLAGRVVAHDADTLTLSLDGGATRVVPWGTVRRLEVSRGRRSAGAGMLRGAGIGLATGVAAGLAVGALGADRSPCPPDAWCIRFTRTESAGIGAMVLGAGGTVVGGLTGLAWPGERWTRVGEPRLSLAPTTGPRGRGAGLALQLSF